VAAIIRAFRAIEATRIADLSHARALLSDYPVRDTDQADFRRRMLAFIAEHPSDAHKRTCLTGHLTASCLLLDHAEERALLTHHAKLGRWLQLGGHLDSDANLPAAAWREATEESGIQGIEFDPTPIDLDIHTIPARGDEPEHLHLDVRFLGRAPAGAQEVRSEESLDLRWFGPNELDQIETDPSVRRLFSLAFD
jgi:8-oxo-dGTP pyrophosphatase MutT (NUDIX family)